LFPNRFKRRRTKQSQTAGVELSARDKEMTLINVLTVSSLVVMVKLAGNEARHQQAMKLMTRASDGVALCATDAPTVNAKMSERMPEAPDVVRCGMTCTGDERCKRFNYVSTEPSPCQLYHYTPTNFDVSRNCQHFYQPGQQNSMT